MIELQGATRRARCISSCRAAEPKAADRPKTTDDPTNSLKKIQRFLTHVSSGTAPGQALGHGSVIAGPQQTKHSGANMSNRTNKRH